MKQGYFTIKEIAEMYGISTHIIRHYEKINMIHPMRTESNYRLYSEQDIYHLNIIRDLRELGVSLEAIQEYLEGRTLDTTIRLLKKNAELIQEEMALLNKKLSGINQRLNILAQLQPDDISIHKVIVKEQKKRKAFRRLAEFTDEAGFEAEMRRLYGEILGVMDLYDFHFVGGIADWHEKKGITYKGVFILEKYVKGSFENGELNQCILEQGTYASYYYQGNYQRTNQFIEEMVSALHEQGYMIIPPFYEFYLIDFHETNDVNEFLTEIQVKVKRA